MHSTSWCKLTEGERSLPSTSILVYIVCLKKNEWFLGSRFFLLRLSSAFPPMELPWHAGKPKCYGSLSRLGQFNVTISQPPILQPNLREDIPRICHHSLLISAWEHVKPPNTSVTTPFARDFDTATEEKKERRKLCLGGTTTCETSSCCWCKCILGTATGRSHSIRSRVKTLDLRIGLYSQRV